MKLLWLLLIVVAVVMGLRFIRRRSLTSGANLWAKPIETAAASLKGRPAIAGGDAELRAEAEGVTVTVKTRGSLLTAEAPLYPEAKEVRIYLASGIEKTPQDLTYLPEAALPPAFGLDPPVILRSDDPLRAAQLAEGSVLDLSGAQREASARAVEVLIRGGTLRLALHGAAEKAAAIERAVSAAARLVVRLGGNRQLAEASIKQLPASTPAIPTCTLCGGQQRPGVAWVKCRRCGSPHHKECWDSAHHCSKEGCGDTHAEPI